MASKIQKSHVVCLPAPAQGHLNSMMKLAKLLHCRGLYITMVLTESDMARLTSSSAAEFQTLQGLQDFKIETIPDNLPPLNKGGVGDSDNPAPELWESLLGNETKEPFKSLVNTLLASSPISAIISDITMLFALAVANKLDIPVVGFCPISGCGMLGYMQYDELVKRGLFPLKDDSCLTNGFLDSPIDWVPGLIRGTTLKHLPTFLRTTNPDDIVFNLSIQAGKNSCIAEGLIITTFYELEAEALEDIKTKIPNLYTIGPLSLFCKQVIGQESLPLRLNLWEEDTSCIEWLDKKRPRSVVYVNFGSSTILTPGQLEEFAWGLANSKHQFLWVIRSDLVKEGFGTIIDKKYREEIKGRGLISGWCPQEKVLQHPSVAVFLTHCGWNSIMESMSEGVPLICWPFFAEQQTNCLYACQEWRIGLEMEEGAVEREKVTEVVREMMEGKEGEEVRRKAMQWKLKAEEATRPAGSSHNSFDKLVNYLM